MAGIEALVALLLKQAGVVGFPGWEGTWSVVETLAATLKVWEVPRLKNGLILHAADGFYEVWIPVGDFLRLLHELAHVLDSKGIPGVSELPAGDRREEGRAERLARALAMPAEACAGLTALEVAEAAGVPVEWAERRLRELEGWAPAPPKARRGIKYDPALEPAEPRRARPGYVLVDGMELTAEEAERRSRLKP